MLTSDCQETAFEPFHISVGHHTSSFCKIWSRASTWQTQPALDIFGASELESMSHHRPDALSCTSSRVVQSSPPRMSCTATARGFRRKMSSSSVDVRRATLVPVRVETAIDGIDGSARSVCLFAWLLRQLTQTTKLVTKCKKRITNEKEQSERMETTCVPAVQHSPSVHSYSAHSWLAAVAIRTFPEDPHAV